MSSIFRVSKKKIRGVIGHYVGGPTIENPLRQIFCTIESHVKQIKSMVFSLGLICVEVGLGKKFCGYVGKGIMLVGL